MSLNYDGLPNVPSIYNLRGWCIAILGALASVQVGANTATFESAYWTQAGNVSTGSINTAPGAVSVPSQSPFQALVKGKNYAFAHNANEWPKATGESTIPGTQNKVTLAGKVVPASAALAIAKAAMKMAAPISIGMGIYDLIKEVNLLTRNTGSGNEILEAQGDVVCPPLPPMWTGLSPGETCGGYAAGASGMHVYVRKPPEYGMCTVSNYCPGYGETNVQDLGPPTVSQGEPKVLTEQEVADKIAAKSGWPSASAISKAIAQAVTLGQPITTVTPTASGPSSSPSSSSTTQQPGTQSQPVGDTTTTTTTKDFKYEGPNVTTSTTTTQSTKSGSTGITTAGPTTSTQETPAPKSTCEAGDTTAGCSTLDVPDGVVPKTTKDISYAAESIFGVGTCPADKTVPQMLTGRPVVLSYVQTCGALKNVISPMIIAIALYMAYLIILPGNRV